MAKTPSHLVAEDDQSVGDRDGYILGSLDTGKASILHMLFAKPPGEKLTLFRSYIMPFVVTAFIMYVPALIVALLTEHAYASKTLLLPYLHDWDGVVMCVISLPIMVCLLLTERTLIPARIASIPRKDNAWVAGDNASKFVARWEARYASINVVSQFLGVSIGALVSYWNYHEIVEKNLGSWQNAGRHTTPAGWFCFLLQLPFLWAIVTIYVIRAVTTIALLNSLAKAVSVRVEPFHPDNCAGLKSIGRIGLRNQYVLASMGANLLAFAYVAYVVSPSAGPDSSGGIFIAAAVAYVLLGPAVFLGPLMPFRAAMLQKKWEEKKKVSERIKSIYDAYLARTFTSEEANREIECAQKVAKMVDRIPVWPFDTSTVRRFLIAYVSPTCIAILPTAVGYLLAFVKNGFKFQF